MNLDMSSDTAALIRSSKRRLLQMHYEAGVGHIGGNLSALDSLLCLHHAVMTDNDLFVLSKGHAAGALYVTLWSIGKLTDEDLTSFHQDRTRLAGHPAPKAIEGIPVATGSLGHGLPLASGMAMAKKFRHEPGRVFCLTSDGEWQEGSNWEALIFARHHKLYNLTILIDRNRLQGFGTTDEVASLGDLRPQLSSFGVTVEEVDGHSWRALSDALSCTDPGPRVIILDTVKGKGIPSFENKLDSHYLPLSDLEYSRAMQELGS